MDSLLLLLLCSGFIAHLVSAERFLLTAPSVFHVGVKEQVSVQVGETLLNKPVKCHLEQEVRRVLMSEIKSVEIKEKGKVEKLELEVAPNKVGDLYSANGEPPYLNLVCDVGDKKRQVTRVLVSQHRGYIFLQTDQPIYNPTQKVRYRIFALDHTMRPKTDIVTVYVHIINSEGNTIKKILQVVNHGVSSKTFNIPDVSLPGVWKIKAYYRGDEKNATVREFKVQKFVLPSFGVSISPEASYLLLNSESFRFSVGALYSYGKTISGGYHCRFGIKHESADITFITGLEMTGAIRDGKAELTLQLLDIRQKLQPVMLEDLSESRAQFYIAVTVTDTISGEVQETEMFLPIVSQKYLVDLSRTRSLYVPKVPFDVVVVVTTPNGLPAKNVPVKINVPNTAEKIKDKNTNDEGTVTVPFNIEQTPPSISVEVTVDGVKTTKVVRPAISSSNSFLYIDVNSKVLSPGDTLNVEFHVVNGKPEDKHIYYMVFSKGVLVQSGSREAGDLTKVPILISAGMTPSFRLIGYYYHTNGDIIADSVWVDVKDVCEKNIEIKPKDPMEFYSPNNYINLKINVGSQTAKVALLAVDKAIYALNAQNKLTPKQVFSSMQSYDLGCSYGGGLNTAAVFNDAGLAFISHSDKIKSQMRKGFGCDSGFRRHKRAVDLQKEMNEKESEFKDKDLQKCCRQGLTLIPMQLSCEERKKRINRKESQACVEAFLTCCKFAVMLREKKKLEDIKNSHGRTANTGMIEDFFNDEQHHIRQNFPPSFDFKEIDVKGETEHKFGIPDSITTWEIQAVSLSSSHGFCVADPVDIRVFKPVFIALRLPYSVKRNEQMAIPVVIHNYEDQREVAVHMEQVEGLCSPGSPSSIYYMNVTLAPKSSEIVTFSVVPLKDGPIPIIIKLYDIKMEMGLDSIQKTLLVKTEGVPMRNEITKTINLDGRQDKTMTIDGDFPNNMVPDSNTNIFVKIEDEVFGVAAAMPLLSPSEVEKLIQAPFGCAEQTMLTMSPTALSIRYLDYSNRWVELSPETRDKALDYLQTAYDRILTFKKPNDGSYGAWVYHPSSNWLTALVVKVLSLVADCQLATKVDQEIVSQEDIRESVNYLLKQQKADGSFDDPNPVIHREMQGGVGGLEQDISLTAFITLALNRSLPFLDRETSAVKLSISRATDYLLSSVDKLKRPFALAITTYCLSTCMSERKLALPAWNKLQKLAVQVGECKVWRANEELRLENEKKPYRVPPAVALTVETTAYVLLAALALGKTEEAKAAACFLSSQENYEGGFKSTQDTIVALEALSEYAMHKPESPFSTINVDFSGKGRTEKLTLNKKGEKVQTELKNLVGGEISAKFTGKGTVKVKVAKAYYALDPTTNCDQLSINITVMGKVQYTEHVVQTYDYYDYGNDEPREEAEDFPRSSIEWFDVRSRRKRDTQQTSEDTLVYKVCVRHSPEQKLSGMAIADITLLSGFEPNREDLDKLKNNIEQYISHYEISQGRVLLYFNEINENGECVDFEAVQKVPIGLVQPAPATFYDYYEPDRRCSVFYAAPQRSKLVSVLCSGEVCQCAERGCFSEKNTFEAKISAEDRFSYACYHPVMDYGLVVTVNSVTKVSNFEMYNTSVIEVLKYSRQATTDMKDIQVFAKRKHCKSQLKEGQTYLIMGKDGSVTNFNGPTVHLLESDTWVEQKHDAGTCRASHKKRWCQEFRSFTAEYRVNGCTH